MKPTTHLVSNKPVECGELIRSTYQPAAAPKPAPHFAFARDGMCIHLWIVQLSSMSTCPSGCPNSPAPTAAKVANTLIIAAVALLLTGCQSAKKTGEGAALVAGVATMTALSPLIPVLDSARELSGKRERQVAKSAAVRARLDPIAEKRIAAIQQRNPVTDAATLYRSGVVALLPSIPGVTNYPGIFGPGYDLQQVSLDPSAAQTSTFFQELEALLNPVSDELAPRKDEARYSSPVVDRYRELTGQYKIAFNREMFRLIMETKSAQTAEL